MSKQAVHIYNIVVMGRSNKGSKRYCYGFFRITKAKHSREIKRVYGLGQFHDKITRSRMIEHYYHRVSVDTIDKVITNIEDFNRDFIYRSTIQVEREHEVCRRYVDNFDYIQYKGSVLQHPKNNEGIWVDDSGKDVRYRFSMETAKMITYFLAFAIDEVIRCNFKELMEAYNTDDEDYALVE